MKKEVLDRILNELPGKTVLVLGDYFLDRYLIIDPQLDEPSVETGLTAYQVVGKRLLPGAAGSVANNFCALGVGEVVALGVAGDDGEGFELLRGLRKSGVNTEHIIVSADRFTPTYTKPIVAEHDGERELNRLDIQNRTPTAASIEARIIGQLKLLSSSVDAIAVLDQVAEENRGVMTRSVRMALAEIGKENPGLPILCDSRAHIGEFRHVMLKPNRSEAMSAYRKHAGAGGSGEELEQAGRYLRSVTGRPVFVTDGSNGQYVMGGLDIVHVPAVPVEGPIDPVGAGDSTTAGILSALSCGASLHDAAMFGNLLASVTVQKIGMTGTASPAEIQSRWNEAQACIGSQERQETK